MDLAPIIRELIMHNECIILPGLGGFETEYIPARFVSEKGIMMPPTKKIIFRPNYVKGGEILKNYLEKKLIISSENADKLIAGYVTEIKSKLDNKQTVEIKGVGTLSPDFTGSPKFLAVKEENYLAESFGLDPLPFKERKQKIAKPEVKPETFKIRQRSNTLSFIVIGIIVISILLAITIILTSRYNLFLFNIGDKKAASEMIIIGGGQANDSIDTKIDNKINESTSLKNALSYTTSPKNVNNNQSLSEKHYIIAGSFGDKTNAETLEKIINKQGFKTEVLLIDNMYRVCLGTFTDKPTALEELHRIRRNMPRSLWLLSLKEN